MEHLHGKRENSTLLFVDDEESFLNSIRREMIDESYHCFFADNGAKALQIMEVESISVLVTDLKMPQMSGLELLEIVQKRFPDTVRIILTGHSDLSSLISAINSGQVYRYLTKPWKRDEEFLPAIRQAIEYYHIRRERQMLMNQLQEKNRILHEQNLKLTELSTRDGLTGVFNHRYFQDEVNRQFAISKRNKTDFTLLILDIDYFKKINDRYGHAFGDFILVELCKLVSKSIRVSDIFARYGGEEFVLLLPTTDIQGGRILGENIRKRVEKSQFSNDPHSIHFTVSIGIASLRTAYPNNPSELFENADKALYEAKKSGRNRVVIFDS